MTRKVTDRSEPAPRIALSTREVELLIEAILTGSLSMDAMAATTRAFRAGQWYWIRSQALDRAVRRADALVAQAYPP